MLVRKRNIQKRVIDQIVIFNQATMVVRKFAIIVLKVKNGHIDTIIGLNTIYMGWTLMKPKHTRWYVDACVKVSIWQIYCKTIRHKVGFKNYMMELDKFVIYVDIITKWTLSLTQSHKTGSWCWGLHPLIYNERL